MHIYFLFSNSWWHAWLRKLCKNACHHNLLTIDKLILCSFLLYIFIYTYLNNKCVYIHTCIVYHHIKQKKWRNVQKMEVMCNCANIIFFLAPFSFCLLIYSPLQKMEMGDKDIKYPMEYYRVCFLQFYH